MIGLLVNLLTLFTILIFLRIVLSWFPPTGGLVDSIQRYLFIATEWALAPLRRVIPPVRLGAAAMDLSPLVLLLGLQLLAGFLAGMA